MTDTKHTSITSLIEQRIRRELQDEARKAVSAFEARLEADIEGLGVSALWTGMSMLVEEVRAKHIDNLVTHRINALVDQLVLRDPKGQMVVQLDQTRMVSKSWSGAGFDALVGQPAAHADQQIAPQAADSTVVCAGDGAVPAGATVILECDRALTDEQKDATEAHALSKLPAGCQVLVLDRGMRASASVAVPVRRDRYDFLG